MQDVIGEREALIDLLNSEKSMMTLYTKAWIESSSPQMRSMVQQGMNQIAQDQWGVFTNMASRGYYAVEAATAEKIQQASAQYANLRQNL